MCYIFGFGRCTCQRLEDGLRALIRWGCQARIENGYGVEDQLIACGRSGWRSTVRRQEQYASPKEGSGGKQVMPEPAVVLEDRMYPGEWRVEWYDDYKLSEVAIFSGRSARKRAIQYAELQYGDYEEVSFGS